MFDPNLLILWNRVENFAGLILQLYGQSFASLQERQEEIERQQARQTLRHL